MTKFIGYLEVKDGEDRCVEWSLATGYTVDGVSVGKSFSELREYVEFCEENDVFADEDLAEYLEEKETKGYWTTEGSIRRCCGHRHRTEEAAERCLKKDQRGCEAQGGYSDRIVIFRS